MRKHHSRAAATALAVVVSLAAAGGCGDDASTGPDTTATGAEAATAVPDAEQVAAMLLTAEDLGAGWTVNVGPADGPDLSNGVIPSEAGDLVPRPELCEAADPAPAAAVEAIDWLAFRQLDLAVADPIAPPEDRTGHLIFAQELIAAGEPAATTQSFVALRDGLAACFGEIPAGEEGPGTATTLDVGTSGEDTAGVLTTIEEAGGWAEWRLHTVVVRQGPVLVVLTVVEIRAGTDPQLDTEDIVGITRAASARLPEGP
ncbi:MAG: hypothetical protein R2755_28660 [Acidimicrobiales bacterium]